MQIRTQLCQVESGVWLWQRLLVADQRPPHPLLSPRADTWRVVPMEREDLLVCLVGQGALVYQPDTEEPAFLTLQEELAEVEATPVALALGVPVEVGHLFRPEVGVLECLAPLPPVELGALGGVLEAGSAWRWYQETELDASGQRLRQALSAAIQALYQPPLADSLARLTTICLLQEGYERLHLALEKMAEAEPAHRSHIAAKLTLLEQARHLVQRQQEPEPVGWLAVRQLIHQVARAYYHLDQTRQARSQVGRPAARAGRGANMPMRVDPERTTLPTLAGPLAPLLGMTLLAPPQGYQSEPGQRLRLQKLFPKGSLHGVGLVELTLAPNPERKETWQDALASLDCLGNDPLVDTFLAVIALIIEATPVGELTGAVVLEPEEILRLCGRKAANRSHWAGLQHTIMDHLLTLSRLHLRATLTRGKWSVRTESPLLHLLGTDEVIETDSADLIWARCEVQLGRWARHAPPFHHQTGSMLRRILQYHPQQDLYAKRIGRYLSLALCDQPEGLEVSVGDLFELAGLMPERKEYRDRARRGLVWALLELSESVGDDLRYEVTDKRSRDARAPQLHPAARPPAMKVAGHCELVGHRQELVSQWGRGWWPAFLQERYRFEPPTWQRGGA